MEPSYPLARELDEATARLDETVARINGDTLGSRLERAAGGETVYRCDCGDSFTFLTLLELHRIEKHDDCDSLDKAVAFLGMTAAEQRGRADLRLIVDGLDPHAFGAVDAVERPYALGRTAKTVVLAPGVSILYVLDDEPARVESQSRIRMVEPADDALLRDSYANVLRVSDQEALENANQHEIQTRLK